MRRLILLIALLSLAAARPIVPATKPTTLPSFPRVALKGEAIPPAQLFDEITNDTGVKFKPQNEDLWTAANRPAAVDVNIDGNFWQAVQQACRLTNMTVYNGPGAEIRLGSGNDAVWSNYPTVSTDLAVVALRELKHTSIRRFAKDAAEPPTLHVRMNAYVDPRLMWSAAYKPVRIIEAKDDAGGAFELAPQGTSASTESPWRFNVDAVLRATKQPGAKLVVFRGELAFVVATQMKDWTIDNILAVANAEQQILGQPVVIEKVTAEGEDYSVKLRATLAKRSLDDANRFNGMLQELASRIELRDVAGEVYKQNGSSGFVSSERFEHTMRFRAPRKETGKPVKMTWRVPAQTIDVTVPFEFRDQVLP